MIFAELRGKIRRTGTRLHERAEDALTSTAFGLLRYVPGNEGLSAVLRRTLKIQLRDNAIFTEEDPSWLGSYHWNRDPMFWPRFRDHGEPDLLLKAFDSGGTVNAVLVIEAKYLS